MWRKKPSKASILAAQNELLFLEERKRNQNLEERVRDLSEQLTSSQSLSDATADLLAKQTAAASQAVAGWEKAEEEITATKHRLKEAQGRLARTEADLTAVNRQFHDLNCQFADTMVELADEQRRRQETEEKLAHEQRQLQETKEKLKDEQRQRRETEDKLADERRWRQETEEKLVAENRRLTRVLEAAERLVKELEAANSSAENEKAELARDLAIRNEEREYDRRSLEAADRQRADGARRITALEEECRRLRAMVRTRLPGPAAVAKMRNEVGLPRRPRRLHAIEDENRILRQALEMKTGELEAMRVLLTQHPAPASDDNDAVSLAGSWTSALPSGASMDPSDLSVVDDYVEIERMTMRLGCHHKQDRGGADVRIIVAKIVEGLEKMRIHDEFAGAADRLLLVCRDLQCGGDACMESFDVELCALMELAWARGVSGENAGKVVCSQNHAPKDSCVGEVPTEATPVHDTTVSCASAENESAREQRTEKESDRIASFRSESKKAGAKFCHVLADALEPENILAADPTMVKEENPATTEPAKAENPTSKPMKADFPITEPKKAENPTTEPTKAENPRTEPSKVVETTTTAASKEENPAAIPVDAANAKHSGGGLLAKIFPRRRQRASAINL